MSRRKTGQAVSLFPFLAVLISAMGALILLLLVTTRKLHHDAVARAKTEQALIQARIDADAEAARNQTPLPLPEDHPAFRSNAAEFVIAIQAPSKRLLPPPPPPAPDRTLEKEQLQREWEAKAAALRENWEQLQQRLSAAQALVGTKAQQEADLAAELARLQEAITKLQAEKGDLSQEVTTVKTTKQTIAQQLAELQSELERLKAEKSAQADKFQLVPYAGSSPTRRRPIIIECEANTVRFASEEISLSARDMSGFTAEYNPARAGADALLKYWEAQRQAASSLAAMQPEPYLLFVIRPGGTVSYYVTRRMLEGLPVDSGYELVTQSQELVWPVSTLDAKIACQMAIDEVLGVRNRLTTNSPDGRLQVDEGLQFEGKNHEFVLEEVQKLRNPEQKTFVGGQRITRQERPRTGGPAYKPPTAPEQGGFVGPRIDDLKDEKGNLPIRRPPSRDELARNSPGQGRPFPFKAPPRTDAGARGTGDVTSTDSAGPLNPGSPSPARMPQPSAMPQQSGTDVDPDRLLTMTPEELEQLRPAPSSARGPVGNYAPGDQTEAGRGAGDSSGEATSQFGDSGEVSDLFSSQTGQAERGSTAHRSLKPHDPTNGLPPRESRQPGQPGGDRTTAVETTDDPTLTGESKPNGVAGGKGTFSGDGPSGAAAPDSIPVQPGAAGAPTGSPMSPPNSTDAMLEKHLPSPLPTPSPNSITAERFVVVTIDSTHIQIGQHEIPIEEGMSSLRLKTAFSKELASAAKRWGRPPAGFHWQPALRFRVRPGGNQYYAWLHSASEEWELRNTVEYVFD